MVLNYAIKKSSPLAVSHMLTFQVCFSFLAFPTLCLLFLLALPLSHPNPFFISGAVIGCLIIPPSHGPIELIRLESHLVATNPSLGVVPEISMCSYRPSGPPLRSPTSFPARYREREREKRREEIERKRELEDLSPRLLTSFLSFLSFCRSLSSRFPK
jgi:hypothetical protein